jgi:iron(II)-dependent oxidoreductase
LAAYRIGLYPVTNADYAEFLRQNRDYSPPRGWRSRLPPEPLDHPVVRVTWYDALAYCRWLSEATGRNYRLPSEAEWERAACGEQGQPYPWGAAWVDDCCNNLTTGLGKTTPVTAYPQGVSPMGCFDMVGNVWEWTSTIWGQTESEYGYPYRPDDGREDLTADKWRVLRGGSFEYGPDQLRCTVRMGYPPNVTTRATLRFGFRVVVG